MTSGEWLRRATSKLEQCGIDTARLDCLLIMEDCLGIERTHILACPMDDLTSIQIRKMNRIIARRAQHEPLAYIRKKCDFYGHTFSVDKRVLVPRPETEAMVDAARNLFADNAPASKHWRLVDIGTGSGCIAISLALELPKSKVTAIDVDASALLVARINAKQLGNSTIEFIQGDLLLPLRETVYETYMVFANLPYVPNESLHDKAAQFEPPRAIFGGNDGLDLYRRFWSQLSSINHKPRYIAVESLPEQHEVQKKLASSAGYQLDSTDNLVQIYFNP